MKAIRIIFVIFSVFIILMLILYNIDTFISIKYEIDENPFTLTESEKIAYLERVGTSQIAHFASYKKRALICFASYILLTLLLLIPRKKKCNFNRHNREYKGK